MLENAKRPASTPCSWAVETRRDGEGVAITLRASGGKWRDVRFGVFRHAVNGQLALLSTCGLGDAWGMLKQPAAER